MYLIIVVTFIFSFFFFNDTATTEIYTLSLHDALPISAGGRDLGLRDALLRLARAQGSPDPRRDPRQRSEEHTSELQSQSNLVCRLLLEKKKKIKKNYDINIHTDKRKLYKTKRDRYD